MPQTLPKTAVPSPRFRQIVEDLRHEIVSGNLPAHAILPSEREVAELQGVSRMTARQALAALETEGLAYCEGRRGRFVSPKRLNYDISNMISFAADTQATEAGLEIELLCKGTVTADSQQSNALSVPVGEELYEYTRLFRINGHATFIETESVIVRRFSGLLEHDLLQSTTRLLEQHYGVIAHRGDVVIRMRALKPHEAELLGLATYHSGIELEQVIRDEDNTPFCTGRQIWRGELAEFSAQTVVNRKATAGRN